MADAFNRQKRLELSRRLATLPAPQLDQVIFVLNPPPGNMPRPDTVAQNRITALLEWVESPMGCGLDALEQAIDQVTDPAYQTATTSEPRRTKRRSFLGLLIPAGFGLAGITLFGLFRRGNDTAPTPNTGDLATEPPTTTLTPTATPPAALPTSPQVDTTRLEQLLAAKEWNQADRETVDLLRGFLNPARDPNIEESTLTLSCDILAAIDSRWVHYSQGLYGFSVQAQIWKDVCNGSPITGNTSPALTCFEKEVGWVVNGSLLTPREMDFDLSVARSGQLPFEAIRIFNDELLEQAWTCNLTAS